MASINKMSISILLSCVYITWMTLLMSPISCAPVTVNEMILALNQDDFNLVDDLAQFGYLPEAKDRKEGEQMSEELVIRAIKSFQKFNGLEETGIPDPETLKMMKSPRCGFPDIIHPSQSDQTTPFSFTALGSRWNQDTVTWRPTTFTQQLGRQEQMTSFEEAFKLWGDKIPLKFRFNQEKADIDIKFATGIHGDGYQNRFKGRGGVLAHAYGPSPGIGGDTHFDDDERWTLGTGEGTDLTIVAAHEFGHALGLGHSSVPGALMAPYYRYFPKLTLHADDVEGIQKLYGKNAAPKPTTPPTTISTTTTTTPTTTTPTTTTTTTTPTSTTTATTPTSTTTTMKPSTTTSTTTTTTTETTTTRRSIPPTTDFCNSDFAIDAISEGPDGFTYAFRKNEIFKIGSRGLEIGFPKDIRDVFPQAPTQIAAVTYAPVTRKTYMFKNQMVWRFTGFQLDPGYPKNTLDRSSLHRVASAFTLTYQGYSRVFLFSGHQFWEWSTKSERPYLGYPLSSRRFFPSAPYHPDAVRLDERGNFYFFKFNRMMKLTHRGAKPQYVDLATGLFDNVCRTSNSHRHHYDSILV